MKLIKNIKNLIIYYLLGIKKTYDTEAEQRWLLSVAESQGFKSWLHFRDVSLLKEIAVKIETRDFQSALEINGRRLEILRIAAEAQKEKCKEEINNNIKKFKNKINN